MSRATLCVLFAFAALPLCAHAADQSAVGDWSGALHQGDAAYRVRFHVQAATDVVEPVADIALIVNLILLIGIMSVFGFTLTLPGIAGIVLTMGIAVDSNVLVYERIREEWRHGRTALNSIETGFKAALATVLDSNFTALIAAVVLFGVGSGPVRGFAITHAIGILTTLFTAFTFTRLIVSWWVRTTKPKEVPL